MPIWRLYGGRRDSGLPSSRISPKVGVSKPASIISVVVLPEPDGPSSVRNSPRSMSRWRSSTTRVDAVVGLADADEADDRAPPWSYVLPAVDRDLRPGDVGACGEHRNQIRSATSSVVPSRCIGMSRSTISGGPRRQDRGVDLAGRNRVDPHAGRREVERELARQRRERRLRRRVRRAGERCTREPAIDVRLTTAPRALESSGAKPRVSSSGA